MVKLELKHLNSDLARQLIYTANPYFKGKDVKITGINANSLTITINFAVEDKFKQLAIVLDKDDVRSIDIYYIKNKKVKNGRVDNHIGVYKKMIELGIVKL